MLCDFVADKLFRKGIADGKIDPAMLEAIKNHNFIDTILSWLKRIVEKLKNHPLQAELIKMQNDIEQLYKKASKQGFADDEVKYSLADTQNTLEGDSESQKNTDNKDGVKRMNDIDSDGSFINGVSQEEIDEYVKKAKSKENTLDYKKYAKPSARLISDVSEDIDLTGYTHTLRDNDIRHIFNSHGINTNEKYPVTEDDISRIPDIVKNYDKVFVVEHKGSKNSIYYVKVIDDKLVYYLEQVTDKYGNELLLVNKQMVKTGINDVADFKNLTTEISKKEGITKFLADLQKIHKEYAQSDVSYTFNSSISDNSKNVKKNGNVKNMLVDKPKSDIDTDYLKAVESGDMETAQKMVDEAAKKAGYTVKAYHGTLTKGITEFKKEFIGSRFSYDEVGFFFTDNLSIAEDYATSEFNADRKGEVISAYLKTSNAFVFDKNYALKNGYGNVFRDNDNINVWDIYQTALLEEAEEHNADSIIIKDGQSMMIVVFDPNQIKSADPVTYDDDGNVIPLSQRFNENQDDIRYSLDVKLDDETFDGEVYGTIPPGEKPARVVRVPKKVDGTYTNRFVRTIMEHGDVSELQVELLKDGVLHETENFRHEVVKDKSAIEYAQNRVKDGSAEDEFRDFADGIIKKFEPGYMKKKNAYFCMCEILNHLQTA